MKKTYLSHNKKRNLADWPELSLEKNEGERDLDLSQADFFFLHWRLCFVDIFLLFHPSFVFVFVVFCFDLVFFCSKVNFNRVLV